MIPKSGYRFSEEIMLNQSHHCPVAQVDQSVGFRSRRPRVRVTPGQPRRAPLERPAIGLENRGVPQGQGFEPSALRQTSRRARLGLTTRASARGARTFFAGWQLEPQAPLPRPTSDPEAGRRRAQESVKLPLYAVQVQVLPSGPIPCGYSSVAERLGAIEEAVGSSP